MVYPVDGNKSRMYQPHHLQIPALRSQSECWSERTLKGYEYQRTYVLYCLHIYLSPGNVYCIILNPRLLLRGIGRGRNREDPISKYNIQAQAHNCVMTTAIAQIHRTCYCLSWENIMENNLRNHGFNPDYLMVLLCPILPIRESRERNLGTIKVSVPGLHKRVGHCRPTQSRQAMF
jgi:hypothetical protein